MTDDISRTPALIRKSQMYRCREYMCSIIVSFKPEAMELTWLEAIALSTPKVKVVTSEVG